MEETKTGHQKEMEMLQAAKINLEEKRRQLETMSQKLNVEKAEMEQMKIQMISKDRELQMEKNKVQEKLKILEGLDDDQEDLRQEKVQIG